VPDAIMVIDSEYRIILVNRVAREFATAGVDLSEPQFCYRLSHQLNTPCSGDSNPCPLALVQSSGTPVTVVHEHYQAGGEKRLIEVNVSPLTASDGSFLGIIESMRDITEQQQAEKERQRYAVGLRALTTRLADVAEAERQRLSRELHDQVGQNLTALGINLNIIRSELLDTASPSLQHRIEDSLALVMQTTESIRDVMADLRPPVLDDYGLVAALEWYGRRYSQRTNTNVFVEGHEPVPRLAPRVENALFCIGQKALNNVAKHAQATQVIVTLEASPNLVRLTVADNGIGFDLARLSDGSELPGWGILTMTERADAVGGRCRIDSQPGQGTRVVVEVKP
jgi:two-component system sensor histidine kinase UhpB